MIYTSAVYANAEHTLVIGTDEFGNSETVPTDHTVFRCPEHGPIGFLASGGVIADYINPTYSKFPNLEPDQFWFVVRVSGYEPDLKAWVASLQDTDTLSWAAASAKLEFAKFFERDHPFVEAAREAIGMTPEELDALWSYATQ